MFEIDPNVVYLNTAAEGIWPTCTVDAVQAAAARMRSIGPDSGGNPLFDEVRAGLADICGAKRDDIVLTSSTSLGLNIALQGIDWRAGDNIVLPAREFPAVETAAGHLIARGVEVRQASFTGVGATVRELLAACTPRTRAIIVSGIAWNTGYKMDLAALGPACAQRGILLIVDGVQLVGAEPLALTEWQVSAVAFHGYKWLMAGFGLGGLFVSPAAQNQIAPVFLGNHGLAEQMQLPAGTHRVFASAQRYAMGGTNVLGAVAMRSSVALLRERGMQQVAAHNHALAAALADGIRQVLPDARVLRAPDAVNQSAIVVFTTGDAARDAHIVAHWQAHGVYAALRSAGIRIAAHVYNTPHDVERALSALAGS
jgi:cysteine desulfurase / selenocysteine lyase